MNYSIYRLNIKEIVIYGIGYVAIDALTAYTFYDSIYAFFILLPVVFVFLKWISRMLCKKRKNNLRYQFCEMIGFLSTSLVAGASVENALKDCRVEMEKLFSKDSLIVYELSDINKKLSLNMTVSHCLKDFSDRAKMEDISDFTVIFTEAVRSGGNLSFIISNTVSSIQDKQRIEEEVESMLKGKLLEQKVMMIMPFMIILYLRISSREFIKLLYHNTTGIIVMTLCLLVFVAAYIISEKIINIKV